MKSLEPGPRPGVARPSLDWAPPGLLALLLLAACVDSEVRTESQPDSVNGGADAGVAEGGADASLPVAAAQVTVDLAAPRATVAPHAFGMHASVYDNGLHNPSVPALLGEAGVSLLRWPGGGYSDNYHWSTHQMTPWYGDPTELGYLARGSDFGGFVALVDSFRGAAMITVNYGSNLDGTGPGEPKEAAAWVAYANGDPVDPTPIGLDSTGNDWQSIGYWATLRASQKLSVDDGRNFLRIARPAPLGVVYWEVGNEVYGNGYYGSMYEEDLHVPFDGTERVGNPALSGAAYGQGVNAYSAAMKAVDPSIKVGAVLNTPPMDDSWGPTWNEDVLGQCGPTIDFAVVHWYTGRSAASLLRAPGTRVGEMTRLLRESIAASGALDPVRVELAMTEIGPRPEFPQGESQAIGLFAADVYLTLFEHGFVNVDWLELHNGSFLGEFDQAEGPAFHGIQLAHTLASPGDQLVTATSDQSLIVAHAAARADGTVAVMLINTQPSTATSVGVAIAGPTLAAEATRFDYLPVGTESGTVSGPTPMSGVGNQFAVELAPNSATLLVLTPCGGGCG